MKKNNRKGFTITELVIVIAVIAILAAVLIPTFSSIITKAQNSRDLQAARAAYTEYMANVDYAGGASALTDGHIKVDDDTFFKVVGGSLQDEVFTAAPDGSTLITSVS